MNAPTNRKLVGWKMIAAHLRVNLRTARKYASKRYTEEERLPISRMYPRGSSPVTAYTEELDDWEKRTHRRKRYATND